MQELILRHVNFEKGPQGLHAWMFQFEAHGLDCAGSFTVKVNTKTSANLAASEVKARERVFDLVRQLLASAEAEIIIE